MGNNKWIFILKAPGLAALINYAFYLVFSFVNKKFPEISFEFVKNYDFFSPAFLILIILITFIQYIEWFYETKKAAIIKDIFDKSPNNPNNLIENTSITFDHSNDDITLKVFRRLKLRYGILSAIFSDAKKIPIITNFSIYQSSRPRISIRANFPTTKIKRRIINSIQLSKNSQNALHIRQYNMAVTDLFVEKALSFLNRKARKYEYTAYLLFIIIFALGTFTVYNAYIGIKKSPFIDIVDEDISITWARITILFIKSFTFYGLLILAISYLYRMIKSLFDQAERIKDRRHALRQGRLYVHLKGGIVDLEEMKEAFNWNSTQPNAFSEFNPDAQAPWGNFSKEALKTIQEGLKSIQINCK